MGENTHNIGGITVEGVWRNKGVWHCPPAYRPAGLPRAKYGGVLGYADYGYNMGGLGSCNASVASSYGLSETCSSGSDFLDHVRHLRESQIAKPSEMMALGDAIMGDSIQFMDGQIFKLKGGQRLQEETTNWYIGAYDLAADTRRVRARHQDTANVVFCDGHAESPALSFLFSTTNDVALSRWNRDNLPHRELLPLWGIAN